MLADGYPFSVSNHVNHDSDDRESHAIAYHWASRVMTICLEMVLPGVLGLFADKQFGTRFVFTLIGFSVGLVLGVVHLIRLTDKMSAGGSNSDGSNSDGSNSDGSNSDGSNSDGSNSTAEKEQER